MDEVWSRKSDSILRVGRSLEELGIRNWALTKRQALEALEQLASADIAVLGGDVYPTSQGTIHSSRENWYCDRSPGEGWSSFVKRSVGEARKYIENYKTAERKDALFAIVPGEDKKLKEAQDGT